MKTFLILAYVCLSFQCVLCRDFYMGMFRKDDFLVAQDNVYKERRPYSFARAEYGRIFKCPITYFRIVDRLGVRGGVTTTIVRGGLLKKYITVRLRSCYNCPISVNIYIGCENKKTMTTPEEEIESTSVTTNMTAADKNETLQNADGENNKMEGGEEEGNTKTGGGEENNAEKVEGEESENVEEAAPEE